jgi:hypothetical protein
MLHLFLTMGVDIMAKLEAEVERRGAVVQQS